MPREKDIYNFMVALLGMSVTMLWRKKPKNQPNASNSAPEEDTPYRWDNDKWSVPGAYKHWEAGNSDYQSDERRYWGHQVWALWTGVGIAN